jgi:hypothetical protein
MNSQHIDPSAAVSTAVQKLVELRGMILHCGP